MRVGIWDLLCTCAELNSGYEVSMKITYMWSTTSAIREGGRWGLVWVRVWVVWDLLGACAEHNNRYWENMKTWTLNLSMSRTMSMRGPSCQSLDFLCTMAVHMCGAQEWVWGEVPQDIVVPFWRYWLTHTKALPQLQSDQMIDNRSKYVQCFFCKNTALHQHTTPSPISSSAWRSLWIGSSSRPIELR